MLGHHAQYGVGFQSLDVKKRVSQATVSDEFVTRWFDSGPT